METFREYQRAAARTGGSDLKPENRDKGLNCAAMGLAGEAGEVCDLVKKVQHHRAPLDETKLRKELGDVLWYLAHACNVMGWDLGTDVARLNIEKLRARYPNGFSTADSLTRADEAAPPVSYAWLKEPDSIGLWWLARPGLPLAMVHIDERGYRNPVLGTPLDEEPTDGRRWLRVIVPAIPLNIPGSAT